MARRSRLTTRRAAGSCGSSATRARPFREPLLKILHVAAGNLYGGVETGLIAFAEHPLEGLEQEVALFFENGRLAEELAAKGTRVHPLGAARIRYPWTVIRARRRLRRLLRADRFAAVIVHSSWSHSILAPVIRETDTQFVHSVHGFLEGRHFLEKWAALSKPDLVITNSRATEASVPLVFPGARTFVVYPPVTRPPASRTTRAEVRAALQTPEDAIVICMASRLEP